MVGVTEMESDMQWSSEAWSGPDTETQDVWGFGALSQSNILLLSYCIFTFVKQDVYD